MIQSMTGYGKATLNLKNANFTIEVRSLNSKQVDINIKMSSAYREKEMALRKLLSEKLQRGKIELSIWRESSESSKKHTLNTELIKQYYQEILHLKDDLNLKNNIWGTNFYRLNKVEIIPTLLKMPEVMKKKEEHLSEDDWEDISTGINDAITNILQFRLDEGKKLEKDIRKRIDIITQLLKEVTPLAKKRIQKVRSNLQDKFTKLDFKKIDANRLEQELLYYLEKQDITEEQVRLDTHLQYFLQTMKTTSPNGKKLGFIVQEMGREINTIGSKSSDAEMQKIVVQMKDELEKIKEQLLNIL